jgi:hypothetical protein
MLPGMRTIDQSPAGQIARFRFAATMPSSNKQKEKSTDTAH